ncbi:FAD-dependent oxidoreductase, partial [Amycolatopsis cihanbeyliensis]
MTRVVVIGAGPAGLAAAEHALRAGATVTVLDEAERPGGQYHRMLPRAYAARSQHRLQHGWRAFDRRQRRVREHPRCTFSARTSVWALEPRADLPPLVHLLRGAADAAGGRAVLDPDALVLAT